MLRTVIARLRAGAAILPAKLDERLEAFAALVNGGFDVSNLSPAVRFPAAQFAEGRSLSFLSCGEYGTGDPRQNLGLPLLYDHLGVVPLAGAQLVAVCVDVVLAAPAGSVWAGGTCDILGDSDGRVLAQVTVVPVALGASGHVRDSRAYWQGVTYLANPAAIVQGERLSVRMPWSAQTRVQAAIALPHA